MESSSCPTMNTINIHDITSNEEILAFVKYDNNRIGNVQIACESGELKIPKVINVEKHDDAYIIETHLKVLWKQKLFWKPHYSTSFTWAFFKVNNNELMDLDYNQIMRYIICHNDFVGPKILIMCTKCKKRLISYDKTNGIIVMRKHVDVNHYALLKNGKDLSISLAKASFDQDPSKKRAHASPSIIFRYFFTKNKFRKDDPTQVGF